MCEDCLVLKCIAYKTLGRNNTVLYSFTYDLVFCSFKLTCIAPVQITINYYIIQIKKKQQSKFIWI